MAYSHVLLTGLVLLSCATLPIEALRQKASHLENNAINEATALKLASGANSNVFPRACLLREGETFTITRNVKGGGSDVILKTETFTRYCRVASDGGGTGLDEDTRKKMAQLLASQSEFIGSLFTEETLLIRVGEATANVWIENANGDIAANVAFLNPIKTKECTMGEMGALAIAPIYQSWGLTQYLTLLTDMALEEGFTYFYTETKVTNRRSLQLQIPRPEFNKFFFTNSLRKAKGMGRVIGFTRWIRDRGEYMAAGTVDVILLSYTGSGLFPMRSFMTKDRDEICARQVMDWMVASGDWEEVKRFTKEDLQEQLELDPSTSSRVAKSKSGGTKGLADLINKRLKLK